jgi:hypothetical protein
VLLPLGVPHISQRSMTCLLPLNVQARQAHVLLALLPLLLPLPPYSCLLLLAAAEPASLPAA